MRQYAGMGTPEETNRRFHYLWRQGQTGFSLAFDLPTQMGLDSDHPLAEAEVGRVGVPIDSVDDLEKVLQGLPLDQISLSMTINAPAMILVAMLQVVAERQGVQLDQLRGTIQNDLLKEYVARGTYIFPVEPALRLTGDLVLAMQQTMPRFYPLSVSGYHMREAGCTAVQELAFSFAHALTYLRLAEERGLHPDQWAERITFFYASHNDWLTEIAKFRAARTIWARLLREYCGAKRAASWKLRFHTQTAGSTLTYSQPENNLIRVTLQALAAVLGGTQSLHTNGYDEAYCLPSEQAAQLALRTQQILAYESGISQYVDPLGGSEIVEQLTERIVNRVWRMVMWIERQGGSLVAIRQGWFQRAIRKEAYRTHKRIEQGKETIVGVNRWQNESEGGSPPLSISQGLFEQRKQLSRLKRERDNRKVKEALKLIRRLAGSQENLYPAVLQAVRERATLGEICAVLREVWGTYGEEI
jgi:methylmalonyl-CoA mutase N-terminal domain/subunit